MDPLEDYYKTLKKVNELKQNTKQVKEKRKQWRDAEKSLDHPDEPIQVRPKEIATYSA